MQDIFAFPLDNLCLQKYTKDLDWIIKHYAASPDQKILFCQMELYWRSLHTAA